MNDKILDPRIKKFHDAIIDYTNSIYSIYPLVELKS